MKEGLAKPDCEKFASTILNQLKGGSLGATLESFLNPKKPHDLFTHVRPSTSRGAGTTIGRLKDRSAQIYLPTSNNLTQDADGVIAELFHLAGDSYTEKQLADALRKTDYAKEEALAFPDGTANIYDKSFIQKGTDAQATANAYGDYFHTIAMRHCGFADPVTRRRTP